MLHGTFGRASGPPAAQLVLCHATGFCKEVFRPFLDDLAAAWRDGPQVSYVAVDVSGHGDARPLPQPCHWGEFLPEDVMAAVRATATDADSRTPRIGIGHSMGAAALVLTELAHPGTFSSLVLCEPILPPEGSAAGNQRLSDMVAKRRGAWPSREAALASLQRKPLYASWDARALQAFVEGGLRPTDTDAGAGVELKCAPAVEAQVYLGPAEGVRARLGELQLPVLVMAGEHTGHLFDADGWEALARDFPDGRFLCCPGASHFFVMERPGFVAAAVGAWLSVPPGSRL